MQEFECLSGRGISGNFRVEVVNKVIGLDQGRLVTQDSVDVFLVVNQLEVTLSADRYNFLAEVVLA